MYYPIYKRFLFKVYILSTPLILHILLDLFIHICILVLPSMASIVSKKKGKKTYYYAVESARVNGKPRIVHQDYLGTAERIAALVKGRSAPVPPLRDRPRVRPLRRSLARRQTDWRFRSAPIPLACTALRPLSCSLYPACRHSPHLRTRPQNGSERLV